MDVADREEIRDLLARYNLAIDFGDADGWAACFTPDGVFECTGLDADNPLGGRHAGTAALAAYAATHFGIMKGRARHWNNNLLIEGDGEQATMRCYLLELILARTFTTATGVYDDDLRKVGGRWLFTRRHIAIDAPRAD